MNNEIKIQPSKGNNKVEISNNFAQYFEQLAKKHADDAKESELLAKDWANKLGSTVDDTEYSAKHYALKSKEEHDGAVTDIATAKTELEQSIATGLEDYNTNAQTKSDSLQKQFDTSISNIKKQETTSINAVKIKQTMAESSITELKTSAELTITNGMSDITANKEQSMFAIDENRKNTLAEIESAKSGAVSSVNTTKDNAISIVKQTGTDEYNKILSTGIDSKLGKNRITNCILEAPNGVATYSGNILTVKQGLKVLIPNGRNADGTLKNIEYTLENDITKTVTTTYEHQNVFFIKNDGICYTFGSESIAFFNKLADRPTPATGIYICCFVEETNFWYVTSNGSPYEEFKMAKLGTVSNNASSQITLLTSKLPFRAVDENDIDGKWVCQSKTLISFSNNNFPSNYNVTFDLSNYLVQGAHKYELIVDGYGGTSAAWNTVSVGLRSSCMSVLLFKNYANSPVQTHGSATIIVGQDRQLTVFSASSQTVSDVGINIQAYRKVV